MAKAARVLTPTEQALQTYLDSPAVREKRAREALEAAIARDNPAPPAPSNLTFSEQLLRDFYADPQRREDKARKALEDAMKREAEAAKPAAEPTPSEKKLADFHADPQRREANAKKALGEARKREFEENAGFGYKAGKAVGGEIVNVLGQVAGKFLAVAGPMGILGAVLGSATSGFQTVTKAVNLLGAVLSPVLLPATVLLATAITAAADVLEGGLSGSLEPFFDFVLGLGIPAVVGFISALQLATEALGELQAVSDLSAFGLKETGDDIADFLNRNILGVSQEQLDQARERRAKGIPDETEEIVLGALRDVMGSLRTSIGPRAQVTGLSGVGQAVQQAALAQDPIEAKMLRIQTQIFTVLERAVSKATGRPVYGGGDYGAGGAAGGDI